MQLKIELIFESETQRWWADIPEIPGVSCYASTPAEAEQNIKSLALQVLADLIVHQEMAPPTDISFIMPALSA